MKRFQLIEIEDQAWLPTSVRDALTDYLQFMTERTKPYSPIIPLLERAVELTEAKRIIDLCSGGAGPWFSLQTNLRHIASIKVTLTDKFPNIKAFQRAQSLSNGTMDFVSESVDATDVPADLDGFRTLFASFHHFRPSQARAILSDAAAKRQGIAVFEVTHRSVSAIALMFLMPLFVLIFTPFIRPFRLSRLLWTYLVPAVPLIVLFDGIVSCLRTYNTSELRAMTAELLTETEYRWEIGEQKVEGAPLPVTYLIGCPRDNKRTISDQTSVVKTYTVSG